MGAGEDRPGYLYHGSPALLQVIEPRAARGIGAEHDRLAAVYASHQRRFAIPFALTIVRTESGGYGWSMSLEEGEPRIQILAGHLDLSRHGYLYRVPADTFEPIDERQWVSYEPVLPLDYEVVQPQDYLHWFRRVEGIVNDVGFSGYHPGAIGRITELHGAYYSTNWGFGLFFEAKVAAELSAFLRGFDPDRDFFQVLLVDGKVAGSIAIDGTGAGTVGARLRWFIVAPQYQGQGLGTAMIREAVDFCRRTGYARVYLTSFAGLDAARHLYEKMGFKLRDEQEGAHWGKAVAEQTFELVL